MTSILETSIKEKGLVFLGLMCCVAVEQANAGGFVDRRNTCMAPADFARNMKGLHLLTSVFRMLKISFAFDEVAIAQLGER